VFDVVLVLLTEKGKPLSLKSDFINLPKVLKVQ
jgi:hypothetical protein